MTISEILYFTMYILLPNKENLWSIIINIHVFDAIILSYSFNVF